MCWEADRDYAALVLSSTEYRGWTGLALELDKPKFKFRHHHLLVIQHWADFFVFPSSSALIYQIGIRKQFSRSWWRIKGGGAEASRTAAASSVNTGLFPYLYL